MDAWAQLAYLESRDLAASLYREAHDRQASATRALSIVAHIGQGRRYFEAAASADPLVRPPLLFYGVIALSRGLISFLDPSRGDEALSPKHGIQAERWQEILGRSSDDSPNRLRRLADLKASFSAGTFTELVTATKNRERGQVVVQPFDESLEWTAEGTQDLGGSTTTLQDTFARIPDLAVTYVRTFSSIGRCYPAHRSGPRGWV